MMPSRETPWVVDCTRRELPPRSDRSSEFHERREWCESMRGSYEIEPIGDQPGTSSDGVSLPVRE